MSRAQWTSLTDVQLLAQCETDTYRASGPGGQKRNKTSSAVRLRHRPSGLIVIAEESRSQHENRARALRRLREALYLDLREPPQDLSPIESARNSVGRLDVGKRDPRYLPAAAVLLDLFEQAHGGMRDLSERVQSTTGNLVDFLSADDNVWRAANAVRSRHGRPALRA